MSNAKANLSDGFGQLKDATKTLSADGSDCPARRISRLSGRLLLALQLAFPESLG